MRAAIVPSANSPWVAIGAGVDQPASSFNKLFSLAKRPSDEGQQLGCNLLRHLSVRIVPRPVNNQDVGMKLRGEPTSFGCCIREVRIACAHHDESGARLWDTMAAVSALDRPIIARSAAIRPGSCRFCFNAALTWSWSAGLRVGNRLFQ